MNQIDSGNKSLLKLIEKGDIVGYALIDHEKIIRPTESLARILKYPSISDLKNAKLEKIFKPEDAERIRSICFGSEKVVLEKVELTAFDGSLRIVLIETQRIRYSERDALLLQIANITKEETLKTFYHLVSATNKSLIFNEDEEDFLTDVCNRMTKTKYVDQAWVVKSNGSSLEVVVHSGQDEFIKQSFKGLIKAYRRGDGAPIIDAVKQGKIVFVEDIEKSEVVKPFAHYLLGYGLRSSCYIPIKKNGSYSYSLNLYSRVPYYFSDYLMPVLEEIQLDLNFFFKNYKQILFKKIFSEAIKNTQDWVLVTDVDGNIIYANESVSRFSGYEISEIIGSKPSIFKSGIYDNSFYESLWETILLGKVYRGIMVNKHKNGELYQLYHTITPIKTKGRVTYFVDLSKDVSREVYLEEQIRKFKYYDQLTGLLNTQGFVNEIGLILDELKEKGIETVVIVLDIYEFNKINKVYGFDLGDRLLVEIAKILSNKGKIVGRLGDDEFGLFVSFKERDELEDRINDLLKLFEEPIQIDDKNITVPINIGAALVDTSYSIKNDISNANNALRQAKDFGPYRFKIFDDDLNDLIYKDFQVKKLIKESLENRYFTFHMQSIFSSYTCEIAEFEMLVRIDHPKKGLIYPGEFIDTLEKSEYLSSFETYLLNSAVSCLKQMEGQAKKVIPVSINLSMSSLSSGAIFDVLESIDKQYVHHINVEVTERLFSEDLEKAKDTLTKIKEMGFKIMIDDFGTGYSSLSYIHTLPVDALKIDISFIRNMMVNEKVKEIVRATLIMAKALGIETVAEGVETKEQIELLKEFGCDYLQGYYFSKPVTLDKALEMIKSQL